MANKLATVAAVVGLVLCAPAFGADDRDIDIVGRYNYEQTIVGGGAETGTVTVHHKGDTYKITWEVSGGGKSYEGVGIRTGNLLSVCYSYPGDGERGVAVYEIFSGPKLVGQWSILGGDGKLYPDTWTRKK